MTPDERRTFILEHTVAGSTPLVPEIRLLMGGGSMRLWEAAALADMRPAVPPPYWAWPWAGGQALARHVLDHPGLVHGRRVLDVGAGSGVVGIAAARAGAAEVTAIHGGHERGPRERALEGGSSPPDQCRRGGCDPDTTRALTSSRRRSRNARSGPLSVSSSARR